MSSILLFTQGEVLGNANRVATSPPQGGHLQARSHFSPRLRPWRTQIKLPLHHLGEVACWLNLASHTD